MKSEMVISNTGGMVDPYETSDRWTYSYENESRAHAFGADISIVWAKGHA